MDRRTAARQGENDRKTRRITRIQPIATKIIPKSRRRQGKTDGETTIYMPQKVAIDYMLNLCVALGAAPETCSTWPPSPRPSTTPK